MPSIPVMRPTLPKAEQLLPWLRKIDENHWYSNFGPLESALRDRMGAKAGLDGACVGLFSNGTTALSLALRALAPNGGVCLAPSWTHVGTATAITAAGLSPYFVDCDELTWAIAPNAVGDLATALGACAVLPVVPFGSPFDYAAWDRFASDRGIVVVVDAAAGFDQVVAHGQEIAWRQTPVMLSLHATKALGIGEGGALLSADASLIRTAQQLSNFGIWGKQENAEAFANAKLSEYAAAVGLAALAAWDERRVRLAELAARLFATLSPLGIRFAPGFAGKFVASTCMISVPGRSAAYIESHLAAREIETRRWWRNGVHRLPAFLNYPRTDLSTTEQLSAEFAGIPFFPGLENSELDWILESTIQLAT
jgi:dTDP-4-amino-4,6-dideoxygalactose transaminase